MAALCVILTAACGYDYRDNRIPNYLVLLAAVLGMGWQAWDGGVPGALAFWVQAALAMALLYPFFKIGGLGAGESALRESSYFLILFFADCCNDLIG